MTVATKSWPTNKSAVEYLQLFVDDWMHHIIFRDDGGNGFEVQQRLVNQFPAESRWSETLLPASTIALLHRRTPVHCSQLQLLIGTISSSHFVLDNLFFIFSLHSLHGGCTYSRAGRQNGEDLALIARLSEAESGRTMEVFGSQPSVQVYTANYLSVGECWCLPLPSSRELLRMVGAPSTWYSGGGWQTLVSTFLAEFRGCAN